MIDCGSQCLLCDVPVRYDSYIGCTHGCKYCFVQRKNDDVFGSVQKSASVQALKNFINGYRSKNTNWCDWRIPLHWGGKSDPFQPCEEKYKCTLEALKIFAETQYPVIISTKGKLCIKEPYLSLLSKCNVVMQISVLCDKYDELEKGAPTFKERLQMIEILSKNVQRVIVRCQPYIHDIFQDVKSNIKLFSECGAYGVIFEGMKFLKKKKGLVKCGADYVQPTTILKSDYLKLKDECHKNNLKFYCAENRLRKLGDNLTCCGIDGLENKGFIPNTFNCCHIVNGDKNMKIVDSMKEKSSGLVYNGVFQSAVMHRFCSDKSFYDMTLYCLQEKKDYINQILKG